ncbi:MAG: aminotransferase class V-fold PLP-dependent enzyme [Verrucomicrobia bacterium]|nr:aminotransferase class V-fold PLP-dependent enzyme [Verrucomicrobiota bacterium]
MQKNSSIDAPACEPRLWPLDPQATFLNHGSFGSCPHAVLDFQRELRNRLERQPVQFFVRDFEGLLDHARAELARFVGAAADDLVFVTNATGGVNTVLRSLRFQPGDELLVTDHEYNACRNALDFVAEKSGARVIVAAVPFPVHSTAEIVDRILKLVSSRTRLALLDHVTSQTGIVLPIRQLVVELAERGVEILVDGAHAPGMALLHLEELGATYYTGNCHKWLCAPKGAAFLWVRRDRQPLIRPLTISHGANSRRKDRSRFQIEFGWTGTSDPTACLSVPEAIRYLSSLCSGGWPEVMRRNRELALAGRKTLCEALNIPLPCPDEFIGSIASIPIPDASAVETPPTPLYGDPLQDKLRVHHGIEAPIIPWPAPPKRLLRISAQLYNSLDQYKRLAAAITTELA